jgi:hypothetical protein
MESPANLIHRGVIAIPICLAMIFAAGSAAAQCPDRGTVVDDQVSNLQGKPYQAKEIATIVTDGSNGTKHAVVTKSNLFRDSRGRVRVERFYDGTDNPSEIVPTDIWIDDNCGTSVSLLPAWQTAKISKITLKQPVEEPDRPYCQEVDLNHPPHTGPEGTFEYLGHKFIDGVQIRGERESYYSSVQEKLSGAPPVRVYENWCSISLDTPMGVHTLDEKPKREITIVISDIRQIEPDAALFEIPKGYKITGSDENAAAPSANRGSSGTSAPR